MHSTPTQQLRQAIAAALQKWPWMTQAPDEQRSGITWLELQVALLLDDHIVESLFHAMGGRGWPNVRHERPEPARIFRALRTAMRSTKVQHLNTAMKDMGTKVSRLRGWGISSGLACLQGAPCWGQATKDDVKAVILLAHANQEEDHSRTRANMRLSGRPMTLKGFEAWLTNRAGPMAEQKGLRKAVVRRPPSHT